MMSVEILMKVESMREFVQDLEVFFSSIVYVISRNRVKLSIVITVGEREVQVTMLFATDIRKLFITKSPSILPEKYVDCPSQQYKSRICGAIIGFRLQKKSH